MEDERRAENGAGAVGIGEAGNDLCVNDAEDERGYRDDESEERAGCADIEESARGPNRRTNENECAEGADQRREWNEVGIARVNVMMAAGEVVAEFVGEKNREECQREGQTRC